MRAVIHFLLSKKLWAVVVAQMVASDSRGPWFQSSYQLKKSLRTYAVNCIEKTKMKKKRPELANFKKKQSKHEIIPKVSILILQKPPRFYIF